MAFFAPCTLRATSPQTLVSRTLDDNLLRACSLNNPAAEAVCIREGWNGMLSNRDLGQRKLLEAANAGHAGAMTQLGAALYDRGDNTAAASWLHRGVSMDYSPSKELMEKLGLVHVGTFPFFCARRCKCCHLTDLDGYWARDPWCCMPSGCA